MTNKEIREKIYSILETIYSGSNHIGDVYNNEAVDQIMQIVEESVKEEKLRIIKGGEKYANTQFNTEALSNFLFMLENEKVELSSLKKV